MKKSEIIAKYRNDIAKAMIDRYETAIRCRGRIQYKIYLWEDGEIESLEQVQGDNSYLKPYDSEPRALYYVSTVGEPHYDPYTCIADPLPEDEKESEAILEEVDEWMIDEYRNDIDEIIDQIIEDAEMEEKYDGE